MRRVRGRNDRKTKIERMRERRRMRKRWRTQAGKQQAGGRVGKERKIEREQKPSDCWFKVQRERKKNE